MTAKEHYDKHLAQFYSWMIGDFSKQKELFKIFCQNNGIKPHRTKIAIDLGAGNGVQSVALGELGFKIQAIDFNERLLQELKVNSDGLQIEIIKDDIINVKAHVINSAVDVIVCCGDTIAHLSSFDHLYQLIQDCYYLLDNNGRLILTFRDYSSPLLGTARFIPVRSEEDRILTCIIDYHKDQVIVTDLLHEKQNGNWIQKISSYNKLRLRPQKIMDECEKIGFTITKHDIINRMIYLVLEK